MVPQKIGPWDGIEVGEEGPRNEWRGHLRLYRKPIPGTIGDGVVPDGDRNSQPQRQPPRKSLFGPITSYRSTPRKKDLDKTTSDVAVASRSLPQLYLRDCGPIV
jgi:hypothetical protein